jgi:hypothetical protein
VFRFRLRHPRLFVATFAILAAAAVIVFLLGSGGDSRPDYPYSVLVFEDQGREHLPVGQTFGFYNSDPPTSGPHGPSVDFGVHEEAVPGESLVHNLEHGGVAVLYDCSAGVPLDEAQCRELRDQLAVIVQSGFSAGKLVLLAPYAGMEHRIALTAWRTLDTLDEFDAARIQGFIDHFERLFNPEGF